MNGLYLNHYASQYYDPVKAHEYYLKNRNLKGRTTSGMSEEQKKAWTYSKDQITEDKKAVINSEQMSRDTKIANLRAESKEKRARISEKLKQLSEKLTEEAQDSREDISKEVKSKIDALPEIPKGISANRRSKLMEDRKEKIAEIRGEASKDRETLSADIKKERTENSSEAKGKREAVMSELKSSIQSIRDNFKKKKDEIAAKYESTYQKEYDNIKKNIAGKKNNKKKKQK